MKSIYLQKDKSIFKLDELPADKFAESLGLPGTPKIKFLKKDKVHKKKNAPRIIAAIDTDIKADSENSSEENEERGEGEKVEKVSSLSDIL